MSPLPATFAMELQDLLWSHRTAPNVPKTLEAERQITALIAREFAKYEEDVTKLQAEITNLMDHIDDLEHPYLNSLKHIPETPSGTAGGGDVD